MVVVAPDVEDELFGDSARVARSVSSVVMRAMEQGSRRREEQARREQDGFQQAAAALREREKAQQEAMRAIIAPARDPQWVERATDRDVAIAYVYAEAYAGQDEHARLTRDSLAQQLDQRHGDAARFVDSTLTPEDLEKVPVPADANLSPTQARLVAARDETAEKWANILEVRGEDRASTWLEANLDDAERARLESARLEDRAGVERTEADQDREAAQDVDSSSVEREDRAEDAEYHEDAAAATEDAAQREREGRGEFEHDPALAERGKVDDAERQEAAEAARAAAGGREEPVREQLASWREGKAQGRHRKPARRGQDREASQEMGR